MDFSQARINYNNEFRGKEVLPKSLCTVDGTFVENISIKDVNGNPNEEYYKWEFIYSLISSGKIPSRDYIGAEIYFPKGNIHSAPIKIDSVIFSDIAWIDYYRNYRAKEGGRFAIVLSNAIMSNNTWAFARDWVMEKIRVVALFDLPENVFAETGVNTTILVGYKPSKERLQKLVSDDYSVFTRDIHKVGYKKKTSQRTVKFDNDYKLNPDTFETITNDQGESILDEDFSQIIKEFKEWCINQEIELKKLFLE